MQEQGLERLERKLDSLTERVEEVFQRLVVLEHRPVYQQPCELARKMFDTLVGLQSCGCERLREHLERHRDVGGDWRRALVGVVSGILIGLLTSAFVYAVKGWVSEVHQRVEHKQEWKGLP